MRRDQTICAAACDLQIVLSVSLERTVVFGRILVGSFITEIMAFGAEHPPEDRCEVALIRETTIERNRVELIEQRGEVDVRVHDDSVGFTVWPCDIPVQTRGYLVSNPAHEDLRVFGTRNLET